jgi:hypothetical protein
MLDGSYDEFRIYDYALSMEQVYGNFQAGPGTVNAPAAGVALYPGDANNDRNVNIADAIALLGYLFAQKTPPACAKAADANDDDQLNIADAISILGYLFSQKPLLAPDHAAVTARHTSRVRDLHAERRPRFARHAAGLHDAVQVTPAPDDAREARGSREPRASSFLRRGVRRACRTARPHPSWR